MKLRVALLLLGGLLVAAQLTHPAVAQPASAQSMPLAAFEGKVCRGVLLSYSKSHPLRHFRIWIKVGSGGTETWGEFVPVDDPSPFTQLPPDTRMLHVFTPGFTRLDGGYVVVTSPAGSTTLMVRPNPEAPNALGVRSGQTQGNDRVFECN